MENKSPDGNSAMTVAQVFARRVRQVRRRRDWSQQRLAEEMAKIGHPMPRSAIAKLESGVQRPENISLETSVALCAALGVPLVSMLASLEQHEPVQVTPAITVPAGTVRGWIRGNQWLRDEDDKRLFFTEHPLEELAALQQQRQETPVDPRTGAKPLPAAVVYATNEEGQS